METDLRGSLAALLPRLRRFGLALTGTVAEADDLVQTTCERVLRRGEQLRDHTRLDAWIYGIMRNLWVDEIRARRVRRHDDMEAAADVIGDDGEQVVEGTLTLKAVRQALAQLPAEQRAVLVLVCIDGLRYAEAAAILRIPVGTVMSRLARARQDLRARMNLSSVRATTAPVALRVVRSQPSPPGFTLGKRP